MAIVITPSFKKKLRKKTPAQAGAIMDCLSRLAEDPHHPGLHTHRVQGTDGVWEAYVDDANRVTFEYSGGDLVMRVHCNHDILRQP